MINSKIKKVPKLRFPGFGDEWEEKKLGDIATIKTGNLNAEDALDDGKYTFFDRSVDIKKYDEYSFDNEAIIYGGEGSEFLPRYFNGRYGLHQRAYTIFGIDTIDIKFLYYYMLTQNNHFLRYAVGSTVKSLRMDCFTRCVIPFPNYEEQEKIGDFLSVVDDKIDLLEKKRELLEKYKKGVLQQIFSQKIRFMDKNGQNYPAWKMEQIGKIAKIYQPETITQNVLTKEGYPVYGANGIIGNYNKYNHEHGQIAVTCRGNTCGTINMTAPRSWITGNAMVINLDESKCIDKRFIYYQLKNSNLNYLITGSGQPQITGDIKKHKIKLPKQDEQDKIADFLSGIDEKIEAEERKLASAKEFKKALLQQMFV